MNLSLVRSIDIVEGDSLFIAQIGQGIVTEDPWRLIVLDNRGSFGLVFIDSTGVVTNLVGREGEAPGEFSFPPLAVLETGDALLALNPFGYFAVEAAEVQPITVLPFGMSIRYSSLPGFQVLHRAGRFYVATSVARTGGWFAELGSDWTIKSVFGDSPPLYREGQRGEKNTFLELLGDRHIVTSNNMADYVEVFEETEDGPTLTLQIPIVSAPFRKKTEPYVDFRPEAYICQYIESFSDHRGLFALSDEEFLFVYGTLPPQACTSRRYDTRRFYGLIMDIAGNSVETVELPGDVIAVDSQNRLYILASAVPDERQIAVYELRR